MNLDQYQFLKSEEALTDFLECFERGTWPKSGWHHAAHVAVAGCYLIAYPDDDAADRMRRGVRHYNQCTGIINSDHSGYHETITLFWLAVIRARLREMRDCVPRIEAVRQLVSELAPQRDLFRQYYSVDLLKSVDARRRWMEPDVRPLP